MSNPASLFLLLLLVCVIVNVIIAQDVEVDTSFAIKGSRDDSDLLRGAALGNAGAVVQSIRSGGDVNDRNVGGWTATMFATYYRHAEVVDLLIKSGADLNMQERDGWTALMFAAAQGNNQIVELLLNGNANPLQYNNAGYGAHSVAYFNEFKDLSARIATVGLVRAIQSSDFSAIGVLVQDGADVNAQTEQGATALMVAAAGGQVELVRGLLAHPKIAVDFQEKDGWTAIMFAAYVNQPDIIRMLLDKGVNLQLTSTQGFTPMSIATDFNRPEALQVLRERLELMGKFHAEQIKSQTAQSAATNQQAPPQHAPHQQQQQNAGAGQSQAAAAAAAPEKKSGWRLW